MSASAVVVHGDVEVPQPCRKQECGEVLDESAGTIGMAGRTVRTDSIV